MKTIKVSHTQVAAARALIELRGGEDKVDPVIVRIAHTEKPATTKPAGKAS